MEMVKPEMKSYVWLQTVDGSIQQVEEEVAMFCPVICREILQTGSGTSKTNAVVLPERVSPVTLGSILDYCRFHQMPGHSIKERKAFDDKFVRLDTKKLCELTSAADSLQLKPLVDLTSRALARIIEGKSPEEIREIFNLPDDLTEEEKLEPLKNVTDDPRIRLLNRLYARKRKELKEKEQKIVETEEETVDDRSVDDLLSFINSGEKECEGGKPAKTKKKNRRKKTNAKATNNGIQYAREKNGLPNSFENGKSGPSSECPISAFSPKVDSDDELDPAMKEELDREVEDFARRLNSDWPERMQEFLSLGQERSLTSIPLNGNTSTQKNSRIEV
ncbi:hypothetical protein vseg_011882 [Gypsophila vaccaria]